jgi:hypothetical protein
MKYSARRKKTKGSFHKDKHRPPKELEPQLHGSFRQVHTHDPVKHEKKAPPLLESSEKRLTPTDPLKGFTRLGEVKLYDGRVVGIYGDHGGNLFHVMPNGKFTREAISVGSRERHF